MTLTVWPFVVIKNLCLAELGGSDLLSKVACCDSCDPAGTYCTIVPSCSAGKDNLFDVTSAALTVFKSNGDSRLSGANCGSTLGVPAPVGSK